MTLAIVETPAGVQFAVKVVPGSSRDRIVGVHGDALKVTVATAAERGRANARVLELLAAHLSLPRAALVLLSGATSPHKRVLAQGLSVRELRTRLGL